MIGRLSGKVSEIEENILILDVGGVGYEVLVSHDFADSLELGSEISMAIHTDVRETAISLFGFREKVDKQVFLLLKKVKGIGSKLALSIVSFVGAKQLFRAISLEDKSVLQKVPGVGKKSAERIVIELREQVEEFLDLGEGLPRSINSKIELVDQKKGAIGDAVVALEKLGFSSEQSEAAVEAAISDIPEESKRSSIAAGELLKSALSKLN